MQTGLAQQVVQRRRTGITHHAVQGTDGIKDHIQEYVSARMRQQPGAQVVRGAALLLLLAAADLMVRQQRGRQRPERCWQQVHPLCCILQDQHWLLRPARHIPHEKLDTMPVLQGKIHGIA